MMSEEENIKGAVHSYDTSTTEEVDSQGKSSESEITSEGSILEAGNQEENKELEKSDSWMKEIINMVLYIGIVIGLAILLNKFVIQKVEVDGHSMDYTLADEQQLILEKVSYYFKDPERFDIIVFHPEGMSSETLYIKRIIGLPGETIQIIDGKVYINGEVLEDPYAREAMYEAGIAEEPVHIGENQYFVLGDNRNGSQDSREIGLVEKDSISGRAVLRLWPINKFGLLNNQ